MKTSSDTAAGTGPQRHSLNGETMGTRYTAVFYSTPAIDSAAIGASLFAAVDKVDRQMSTWNPASDLCRLNSAPDNTWIAVPDALAEVLAAALDIGRLSHGAFDAGVGGLVRAWGFGAGARTPAAPPCAPAGYGLANAHLEVDRARGLVRKRARLSLDLSGIAKGYGVDQLAHCLERCGIGSYLVGIDGEMRARGVKPDAEPWAVAIEKPVFGVRAVAGVMQLCDAAIASSGDYRHWRELGGRRYAHTMNPAQQAPVSNRLAAVTVLAPTCMQADAWATALMVLGETEGVRLARERRMDALFVVRDGERLEEILLAGGELVEAD